VTKKLFALLLILLLTLFLCGCFNRNPQETPDYDWVSESKGNQDAVMFGGISQGDLMLLDNLNIPINYDTTLVHNVEPVTYNIRIRNTNDVEVECTFFIYNNGDFVPIAVENHDFVEFYTTTLKGNEVIILPFRINPQILSYDIPSVVLLTCAFIDTNHLEVMKNVNSPMWDVSSVVGVPFRMIASEEVVQKNIYNDNVYTGGIRADYIEDGKNIEEGQLLPSWGLSFGNRINETIPFSISPQLKYNSDLYLRAQGQPDSGLNHALVFANNIPVRVFNGKAFVKFNQEKRNAYSFEIDKQVLVSGGNTLYAVCFNDSAISSMFTDTGSAYMPVMAYTMAYIEVR